MSVSLTKTTAATTAAATPWMRAAILSMALSQGFTFKQVSSNVDQYTKGTKVVQVSWSQVVTSGVVSQGGKVTKTISSGQEGKLQILTTALGHKQMSASQKWSASDLFIWTEGKKVKASRDELKALAQATFKAMA